MPYIGQGLQQGRRQLHTFTATASQTTFVASYTPGYVDVYQNGILLAPSDYTATNGTSVVLGVGAAVSDEITIIAQHLFSVADVVSASTGGTFAGDVTMTGNLTVQGTTITVDTNTAQTLAMGDADKIKLGDDGDLEIYHSGSDSFIDDTGTGSLILRSGTTYIKNAAGTKTSIATNAGAGQTLYFNNTSKFQTTDNGALVGDGLGTEVLTILANSSGESQLRFADGTTGTAAYQGRVEYEHTAGKLNLGAGGTTQVTIDSAGNMGLGTNSPTPTASNYDSASFHIRQVGSSSVGAQIRFSTGVTGHAAGDGTFMAQWADSNFYITNQEANADIRFNAGGNSDMVVFDGQNGGVGINFSDPASTGAKLAVMGIAGSNAVFVKGNAGSGTSWGMGINAGSTSADASFRVYDKDGSNSYLYVRGDGNVGIGTGAPSYKLEVSGTGDTVQYIANANPSGTQGRTLLIRDNYASASQDSKISFSATSSPGQDVYLGKRTTSNAGYFHLTNSSGTEHMTVNMANGNVGIGTDNPSYKLHSETSSGTDYAGYFRNTSGSGNSTSLIARGGANNTSANFQVQDYDGNADFTVTGTGNLDIGTSQTTTSVRINSNARTSVGLNVGGASSTATGIYVDNSDGSATLDIAMLGSGYNAHGASAGDVWFYSPDNINIGGATGSTNEVRILGSGGIRHYFHNTGYIGNPTSQGSFDFNSAGQSQLSIKVAQYTAASGTNIAQANVKVVHSAFGALVFIRGYSPSGYPTAQFCDLVYFGYNASPTILAQQTVAGSPPIRYYTSSGYEMYIRYSSNVLNTKVQIIQSH